MRVGWLWLVFFGCGDRACEQDAVDARGTCEARCQVDFSECDSTCGIVEDECLDACTDVPCREACATDGTSCVQQCGFIQDDCRDACADEEQAAFAACG